MIDLEPIHVRAAWLFRWSRHKLVSDWSEEHKGAMMNPHLVYCHGASGARDEFSRAMDSAQRLFGRVRSQSDRRGENAPIGPTEGPAS